jgi:putative flippase GtrA
MFNHLLNVMRFAVVSGIGLAIDFAVFLVLVELGLSPFAANAVSGASAVSFVYFASVRRIFSYQSGFLLGLFVAYLAYQAAGVTGASLAVGFLSAHFVPPVVSKILILPVTFSANYIFMSLLTRSGRARAPAGQAASVGKEGSSN